MHRTAFSSNVPWMHRHPQARYRMIKRRIMSDTSHLPFRCIRCCASSPSIKNIWLVEAPPRMTSNTGSVFWESLSGNRNGIRDEKLSVLIVLFNCLVRSRRRYSVSSRSWSTCQTCKAWEMVRYTISSRGNIVNQLWKRKFRATTIYSNNKISLGSLLLSW